MATTKKQPLSIAQFVAALSSVAAAYNWTVEKSGQIVATAKRGTANKTGTPLQAVANHKLRQQHLSTVNNDYVASLRLNIPQSVADNVIQASTGSKNRGYPQVLRGKILKAVGLK